MEGLKFRPIYLWISRSTCVSSDFAFVQAGVEDLDLGRLRSVKFYTFAEIYLVIELR